MQRRLVVDISAEDRDFLERVDRDHRSVRGYASYLLHLAIQQQRERLAAELTPESEAA